MVKTIIDNIAEYIHTHWRNLLVYFITPIFILYMVFSVYSYYIKLGENLTLYYTEPQNDIPTDKKVYNLDAINDQTETVTLFTKRTALRQIRIVSAKKFVRLDEFGGEIHKVNACRVIDPADTIAKSERATIGISIWKAIDCPALSEGDYIVTGSILYNYQNVEQEYIYKSRSFRLERPKTT